MYLPSRAVDVDKDVTLVSNLTPLLNISYVSNLQLGGSHISLALEKTVNYKTC